MGILHKAHLKQDGRQAPEVAESFPSWYRFVRGWPCISSKNVGGAAPSPRGEPRTIRQRKRRRQATGRIWLQFGLGDRRTSSWQVCGGAIYAHSLGDLLSSSFRAALRGDATLPSDPEKTDPDAASRQLGHSQTETSIRCKRNSFRCVCRETGASMVRAGAPLGVCFRATLLELCPKKKSVSGDLATDGLWQRLPRASRCRLLSHSHRTGPRLLRTGARQFPVP